MIPTCTITATLEYSDGHPVQGQVRFEPSRLWVIKDGVAYACLAPEVQLEPDGSFVAQVTPTDADECPFLYRVFMPDGVSYEIPVPKNATGYTLRGLVGEHHSGPRPAHG